MKNRGFTLVELMIATTVFSFVMLVSTHAFLRISNAYAKGINNAKVQDTVRNVLADISGQLQLTSNQFVPITSGFGLGINEDAYCVGNNLYVYNIGGYPESMQSTQPHALYKIDTVAGSSCVPDSSAPKKILLPKNARLTEFSINQFGSASTELLYNIKISVILAPVDNPTPAVSNPNTSLIFSNTGYISQPATWRCNESNGSEFCSYNSVSTTVFRRL